MNAERFKEIMNKDESGSRLSEPGCNALKGLLVISKYLPESGVGAVGHDVIYSAGIEELVNAGVTEEDADYLRDLNWMIDEESLACFV